LNHRAALLPATPSLFAFGFRCRSTCCHLELRLTKRSLWDVAPATLSICFKRLSFASKRVKIVHLEVSEYSVHTLQLPFIFAFKSFNNTLNTEQTSSSLNKNNASHNRLHLFAPSDSRLEFLFGTASCSSDQGCSTTCATEGLGDRSRYVMLQNKMHS
jgi:hypothetical protein